MRVSNRVARHLESDPRQDEGIQAERRPNVSYQKPKQDEEDAPVRK